MELNRIRLFSLLFLFGALLWGEAPDWKCALTVFEGDLAGENHFLYRQIPLQLYHEISSYPDHIMSEEELAHKSRDAFLASQEKVLAQWEGLLEQRDALLFSEDPIKYESLTKEINSLRKKYDSADTSGNEEPSSRAISYLAPGEGGILFSSAGEAREKDPDFIITGTIDDAGDFILIELTGISIAREEPFPLWSGAGKTDEIERLVGEMADAVKKTLLGRDWSALSVSADPSRAQVFLNGVSLGVGAVDEETLMPGPALLEVRYPRHKSYREEINLAPGSRTVRTVALEPGEEELVSILSEPAGADVLLGSVYRGQTPLVLPRPLLAEKMILSLEGYDSLSASLGPDTSDEVHFALTAGGVDWEEERLIAKDKFYNTLGWFSLSVAAPLILNGIRENQVQRANSAYAAGDMDTYDEAYNRAYYSTGVFWGSMAVSGALLGVSITRLVKYIKASEKSIEQR